VQREQEEQRVAGPGHPAGRRRGWRERGGARGQVVPADVVVHAHAAEAGEEAGGDHLQGTQELRAHAQPAAWHQVCKCSSLLLLATRTCMPLCASRFERYIFISF